MAVSARGDGRRQEQRKRRETDDQQPIHGRKRNVQGNAPSGPPDDLRDQYRGVVVALGVHTLAQVPARAWDGLAALGVDAVWLMGVWERSPAGLEIALADPALAESFRVALPDLRPGDVIGSPYCVRDYEVDERFGGRAALAHARAQLARARARADPRLRAQPRRARPPVGDRAPRVLHPRHRGGPGARPGAFLRVGDGIVARGRDPYFPPWPDVVQLNAFSPGCGARSPTLLVDVGAQCDGLRCDMAMLMTNEVFARTWGLRAAPEEEFWPQLIARVKWTHPDLVFIAEAYWDMEYALQQQGFDFCYDKRLYDRLAHEGAESVRGHLQADSTTRRGWSASSRTTTSRVRPRRSPAPRPAPRRS